MASKLKLRIHIAPVGFEIDRIVVPAKKMRADKVWLIGHSNLSEDKARPFLDKIKKTLEALQQNDSLHNHFLLNIRQKKELVCFKNELSLALDAFKKSHDLVVVVSFLIPRLVMH